VFSSSESSLGNLFLAKSGDNLFIGFLLDVSFLGGGEQFDVAVGGKVRSDSTVGSVSSSSALLSSVDLDVGDDELVFFEWELLAPQPLELGHKMKTPINEGARQRQGAISCIY